MKKFLVIDDHEIVRVGVKYVLLSLFPSSVVWEAVDEKTAVASLKENAFDLAIMDVQMPDTNIFGLMEYIRNHHSKTKFLVFSMSAEHIYAKKILQAGAMGFVSKNSGLPELQKAIRFALNNQKYISSDLANYFANEMSTGNNNPFQSLTSKELEVCSLLKDGRSVTDISKTLHISTSTVGTHKARILKKLSAKNIADLIEMTKQYNS